MMTCPNCNYENVEAEKICVRCGTPLVNVLAEQRTRKLGDTDFEEGVPKWGVARFGGRMHLILQVLETGQTFAFDAEHVEELVMGRANPDTDELPPIDLTQAGGIDKGVSRKHALILRRDSALHIVDNNSANGTYLNGQKLIAMQPRILRDGDDIRLGHLVVRVTFQQSEA